METWIDQYAKIDYARDEGLEEGMEKGAAQSKAEIARAMLARDIDSLIVQECTGLTPEEVAALKP